MQVLQIRHGQWFGVQYLVLDLKTLSNSEDFIFWGTIPQFWKDPYSIPQFCS